VITVITTPSRSSAEYLKFVAHGDQPPGTMALWTRTQVVIALEDGRVLGPFPIPNDANKP
jgi:hypothetical protein